MKKQTKAYIFAGLSILLWATAASAFKITLRYIDYVRMLLISSLVSLITLLSIILVTNKFFLLKTINSKELIKSLSLGIFNPFLYYLILFKAYSLLPAQLAQPLNFVWPIMIVLLSIPILGQKIKLKKIIAVLISFIGIIIISTKGNITKLDFVHPWGVFLAVFSSIIWALFWILNVKDKKDIIIKLFLNFTSGTILIFIIFLVGNKNGSFNLPGLLGAIYIGLFEMGITFVVWLKALSLSKTTAEVSNFIYLTPFMSLVFIHFIVGEAIHIATILGLIFIVTGIFLQKETKHKLVN